MGKSERVGRSNIVSKDTTENENGMKKEEEGPPPGGGGGDGAKGRKEQENG